MFIFEVAFIFKVLLIFEIVFYKQLISIVHWLTDRDNDFERSGPQGILREKG